MAEKVYKLQCPTCDRRLKVSVRSIAKTIVCPRCNARFTFDSQSNSAVADRRDLFGPPVSDDFSSEPASTKDAFENIDIEQVVAQATGPSRKLNKDDAQQHNRDNRSESQVASEWQKEKKVQSKFDESLQRNGIGLLILSIGLAAVPFFAGEADSLKPLMFYLPASAVVVAFLSSFMLAFAMRRSSIAAILLCGLPFVLIGTFSMVGFFWFLDGGKSKPAFVVEEEAIEEEGLAINDNELLDKGAVIDNAAAKFVPPKNRNRENIRRPVRPDEIADEHPVAPDVSESNLKPSEMTKPREMPDDKTVDELRGELKRANAISKNRNKVEILTARLDDEFSNALVSDSTIRSGDMRAGRFMFSKLAGKSTVYGKASFVFDPVVGLDIGHYDGVEDQWIDYIAPIVGAPEFSDSFVVPDDSKFVGLRFNFQGGGILGVQPVYSNSQSKKALGPWMGVAATPGHGKPVELISKNEIYGLVVYRERLKLVGVRLIEKPIGTVN